MCCAILLNEEWPENVAVRCQLRMCCAILLNKEWPENELIWWMLQLNSVAWMHRRMLHFHSELERAYYLRQYRSVALPSLLSSWHYLKLDLCIQATEFNCSILPKVILYSGYSLFNKMAQQPNVASISDDEVTHDHDY
jgi:hypothetical protein